MSNVIKKVIKNWVEYDIYANWWAAGAGDVTWPSSATNWHLAVFDWTTWKVIKDWWAVPSTSDCVKTSWNQTIAGTKTFSTSPVVPSKSTAAWNNATTIATEAQVYLKQDKLTTQTAYTSKWTSTKVPTITTNTLWQVTTITETSIDFPAETVVSGDSWVTYTIKKSTTAPSWAGSNTITLVVE
jgi:hypothetical protein